MNPEAADALNELIQKLDDLHGELDPTEPEYYWLHQSMENLEEQLSQSDRTFGEEGYKVILAAIRFVQALPIKGQA